MELQDKQNIIGNFVLEMHDTEGQLIKRWEERNLVVTSGRQNLARLLGEEVTNRFVNTIGFGTNGDPAVPDNTALTGAFTKAVSGVVYPNATSVQFNWSLGTTEANGLAIREFGLLTASGVLFARKSRDVITKSADFSLSGSWTIIF